MKASTAARFVAVVAALFASISCGAKTPTEPAPPAYELKTETFTGNVKAGGTTAFPFTIVNPGDIEVAIAELAPVSTLTMGLAVGYWDTATLTCAQQLTTPTATVNVAYAATPDSPGEYCVAIYDVGNVQVSSDFTLRVTHY